MAERYIPEHRRTQFKAKNTFKPEELRRRREEQQVEIRKAKREENLAKRRGITGGDGSRPGASLGAEPDSDDDTAPTESQVSLNTLFFAFYYARYAAACVCNQISGRLNASSAGSFVYLPGGVTALRKIFACANGGVPAADGPTLRCFWQQG